MRDSVSALQIIKQKETSLRRQVEKAREQAESAIRAAHQEADLIASQADRTGLREAEACYQKGIEQARREAQAILTAAQREADVMCRGATARLDNVVQEVVALVLPKMISEEN